MLFDKKVSVETSSYRRRYLASMYNRLNTAKTAFNDYTVASSNYDPYQLKQYAQEVQYDPYQSGVNYRRRVPAEKDQYPPAKRFRSMAVSAVESVSHALVYSAFAAYNYVCSDKKTITYTCSENNPISHEWSGKVLCKDDDNTMSQDEYIMDFTPITIQPAAEKNSSNADKQTLTDYPEKEIRDICSHPSESIYESRQIIESYDMRRKLSPIVRESVVLQTIQSLLNEKTPKRCFDDIDDSWEYIDKVKKLNSFLLTIILIHQ